MLRVLSVVAKIVSCPPAGFARRRCRHIRTRVYPRPSWRKRLALCGASLAAVAFVAGCGGGGGRKESAGRLVTGAGFAFRAPSDWAPTVTPRAAVAKRDEVTLVSVTVLPLLKPYRPRLFPRVVGELDRVAGVLARRLRGRVTIRRTTVVAGGRVRQYQITHGGLVDRLTFVLRGKREFLLTCRWRRQDGEPAACAQLLSSFSFR